jgi:hypothetical protein
MMTRQRPNPGRLSRCLVTLAIDLLLLAPLAQADTDQLQKALIQTEASLKSLEQGDAQGAAAHAEAAKMHVDVATRESKGRTRVQMRACRKQLSNAEQLSRKHQTGKAKIAAGKARNSLKQWLAG